jgi:hypothetical protein
MLDYVEVLERQIKTLEKLQDNIGSDEPSEKCRIAYHIADLMDRIDDWINDCDWDDEEDICDECKDKLSEV